MSLLVPLGGAALAALLLVAAALVGLQRERAFYAAMLLAIASFYPVFAAQSGDASRTVWQVVFALPFVVLALIGYRTKRLLIAVGLAGHALFDLVMHVWEGPQPDWWSGLCLGFDAVAALAVLRFAPGRDALRTL